MKEVRWPYSTIDEWQKNFLEQAKTKRNIILLCGRQVGKSEIVAKAIAEYLLNNPKKKLLIVSGVERQASGLYNKTLRYIELSHKGDLKKGRDKPLRTIFKLRNGSQLITEPLGLDGSGARQHTLNGVVFEEMQLIPEEAYEAITPMLLTTGGFIWMLGTAWSTEGYAYERLSDPDFYVVRVNAEEVAEQRPEPQRSIMLKHLENERERMTEAAYAQEYLAIPSDKVRQIFPDALIKKCMREQRPGSINPERDYLCGVDPAGLGEDEGSISIFKSEDKRVVQVEHIITNKLYTTQTTEMILKLDEKYDFEQISVDDGGVGFGVFSELLDNDQTKNVVVALNNASRPLDYKDEKRKRILSEDMIFKLLKLMEKGQVSLLTDSEIRESLKSYKFEYHKDTKKLIISSNYNHPVQSIMRAVWPWEEEDLNLRVYSIRV